LGPGATRAIWECPADNANDGLLEGILSSGWRGETDPRDVGAQRAQLTEELFPAPVQGICAAEALRILVANPPFIAIERRFSSLSGTRETTTYEALHLFRHSLARITERTMESFGRAGELMIYDALLEELRSVITEPMTGEEFMQERLTRYQASPSVHTIHSAGLEHSLIRATKDEILIHVTHCEWARYFKERHPSVGYLLACSIDDPAYRLLGRGVRFQRRCTLMEGGPYCEFHFYLTKA
jgi:hypothetical protein